MAGSEQQKCKKKRKKNSLVCNGIQGISPLADLLETSPFQNFSFDLMNSSSSSVNYFMACIFKGERPMGSINLRSHAFAISKADMHLADAKYLSVMSPNRYMNSFSMNSFRLPALLKPPTLIYFDSSCLPIIEAQAVQEGLFPESEQVFVFHELIDRSR
jgi:hypothetical protein